MDEREEDALLFIAHPNAALDDLADLLGPGPGAGDTSGAMFPSAAHEGFCRICGKFALLTEEHLPPRGAFNKSTGREPSLEDVLGREEVDPPETGALRQGGVRGYTLCVECNNFTGTRWGREYQEWSRRAAAALSSVPGGIAAVDAIAGSPGWDELIFKSVYPGRYVRQVIAMVLGISGGPELGDRFPASVASRSAASPSHYLNHYGSTC